MSPEQTVLERLRGANPVSDLVSIQAATVAGITSLLEDRRGIMSSDTGIDRPEDTGSHYPEGPLGRRPRWRPVLAFGLGLLLVMAGALAGIWLLGGGTEKDVVSPAPTTAPSGVTDPAPAEPTPAVPSTVGGIEGAVSYNLFVSTVQSNLLSLGDEPVFVAQVAGPIDPGSLYWKLISLEEYDGTNWYPSDQGFTRPAGALGYGREDMKYQGNTVSMAGVVQIRSLRMNYLPALPGVSSLVSDNDLLNDSFTVREDGSLRFDGRTFEGLTYTIESQLPNDSIAALATGANGRLSPLFEAAGEAGLFSATAVPESGGYRPSNLSDYQALPADIDPRIKLMAEQITAAAATTFERAVLIEAFFRSPVEFTYSVDIDAGHSATNLADWLFEADSPNFRTGYCEQFSTAMAVMARELGIPARVALGFTPGEVNEDGLVIVRQRNAHAWVELWLDGHGWVRFDPTPRADGINPATELGFDPRTVTVPNTDPT